MRRALVAGALALAALAGCAARQRTPEEVSGKKPPFPLTSADPHVEPDLVGTTHVVQKGETLYRIARAYGIDPSELMEANGISDPKSLVVGQELFVPGAPRAVDVVTLPPGAAASSQEPETLPRKNPGAKMRWPVQGVLYRGYGVKQGQRHDGIDISAPEGTLVRAAAGGEVIYTGTQSGYGVIVILRHPDALVTLYAHNSAVLVKDGDRVEAGAPIAKVGQSGRTTGPHLHFEVREGTRPRDPMPFLP